MMIEKAAARGTESGRHRPSGPDAQPWHRDSPEVASAAPPGTGPVRNGGTAFPGRLPESTSPRSGTVTQS